MVMIAPPAPPPSPTIGFLRDVSGIQAALLSCTKCGVAQSVTWDKLGLSDDTPFPTIAKSRTWECQRCGGTDITAMPDWRTKRPVTAESKTVDLQALYREGRHR